MLANRSIPPSTVMPVLIYEDVGQASEWLWSVFGFAERVHIGNHRIQLTFGDGAVVVAEPRAAQAGNGADAVARQPPNRRVASHSLLVRVEDANLHCERARQGGARILQPPTDYPFGERQYTAEDFAGHQWTFSQSIADVAPEEWGGTSVGRAVD